jgi:hypothetical protein
LAGRLANGDDYYPEEVAVFAHKLLADRIKPDGSRAALRAYLGTYGTSGTGVERRSRDSSRVSRCRISPNVESKR